MIEIVSNILPTITTKNFQDVLRIAGITHYDKEAFEHHVVSQRIYSKVPTPHTPKKVHLLYDDKAIVHHHYLNDFLQKERLKQIPGFHFHYLMEAMRQLDEKTLFEAGIPSNVSIMMPMKQKQWMHAPEPVIFYVERNGAGKRELKTHTAHTIVDNTVALIVHKY